MTRKIIHIDLDAFFCAVEELCNPKLVGKAFAVGGRPEERGVVSSCSYPARRFGVHSAMPMVVALRQCPELIIISSHYSEYARLSEQMAEHLFGLTPLVEQISIDEAFLDVTEITEPVERTADILQKRINDQLHLPCSLGVATNKLVAKIANDYGKSSTNKDRPPNKITVVDPGKEAEFLAPLTVDRLWGVGPKTADRLNNLGIKTIGDLTQIPELELMRLFGKNGHDLWQHAQGIDDSPIITSHEMKSISQEITFARDISDYDELTRMLRRHSERVGERLRKKGLAGTTVKIKLRWPDFTTITRQENLPSPTNADKEIYETALALFKKAWVPGKTVRLIGVGVAGLDKPSQQLKLWDTGEQMASLKRRQLLEAMDELRDRYGRKVIQQLSDLEGEI